MLGFVRFTDADSVVAYRATYTAYDGRAIAPRLITSPDLVEFAVHRLTGSERITRAWHRFRGWSAALAWL